MPRALRQLATLMNELAAGVRGWQTYFTTPAAGDLLVLYGTTESAELRLLSDRRAEIAVPAGGFADWSATYESAPSVRPRCVRAAFLAPQRWR